MPLDPESCDPAQLARLARLELDDREQALFKGQLRRMIGAFNRVCDLPTEGVAPFAHPFESRSTARRDEPAAGNDDGALIAVPPLFGERRGGTR